MRLRLRSLAGLKVIFHSIPVISTNDTVIVSSETTVKYRYWLWFFCLYQQMVEFTENIRYRGQEADILKKDLDDMSKYVL